MIELTACGAPATPTIAAAFAPSATLDVASTQSSEPPPTIAVAIVPTLPQVIVTHPIGTATPIPSVPSPIPLIEPQPAVRSTSTPTLAPCPPPPTPTALETSAAVEHFEHGLMFWLQARNEIWALIDSPLERQYDWRVLPNLWSEGQPENDPALQPPPGKFQPVRGFGAAWRAGGGPYGPQHNDLGWAVDEEAGFTTALIYYPQGYYSPDCTWLPKSGIYELKDNRGVTVQFVGEGGTAKIVPSNK